MLNLDNTRNRIFHRVHRTGEEIKNDLPNLIERVVDSGAWNEVINPSTMKPFQSVGEWLVANYPLGPGVGQGQYAIKYEELILLCESRTELCKLLKDNRPARKRGGDRKSEDAKIKCDNGTIDKRPHGSNTRLYIEERLKRDHPKVWKDYLDGVYGSARQAGIAAGFIKDTHDALMRLKSNWNKATKSQRKAFMRWIQEESQ
jgi:hypothetical protein